MHSSILYLFVCIFTYFTFVINALKMEAFWCFEYNEKISGLIFKYIPVLCKGQKWKFSLVASG